MIGKFITTTKSAFRSLLAHKVRSTFTTIGVVIGIMTVTIVLSVGDGLKAFIVDQIQSFGSDVLFVEARPPEGITFTLIDTLKTQEAEEISKSGKFPYVKDVYAYFGTQAIASSRYEQITVDIFGTNASFIDIDASKIIQGRFFNKAEEASLKRNIILGHKAAKKLFPSGNPLNQTIKLNKINFNIIGIMKERGSDISMDFDNMIFMPIKVSQKLFTGADYIVFFAVQVTAEKYLQTTKAQIQQFLRFKHSIKGNKDDFAVTTATEAIEMIDGILMGIKFLLLGIGFISLLVGGIGIMNIMYVTVTERIKEIGVRKAVGATSKDILYQFLFEAIIVTCTGAIIGIALGILFIHAIIGAANYYGFFWPYSLSIEGIIWAFIVSLIFGLVFGLAPARKAARQNPIEALRDQ